MSKRPDTISEDTLALLETILEVKLPKSYRAFMAERNGRLPGGDQPISFTNVLTGEVSTSRVHHGLGINTGTTYDDLWVVNARNDYWMGPDYLIIADDPFGNPIALCIRGPHYRKVLFLDHEVVETMPATGDPLSEGVSIIANDFSDFLSMIQG